MQTAANEAALNGLEALRGEPVYFSDCCAGISWPLLEILAERLPQAPALTLSVGCGSGRLESMLLRATDQLVNVVGVEVSSCSSFHLPADRLLRVPSTSSMHREAWTASALMFVYPRSPALVQRYVDSSRVGALEQVVWLGPRRDWEDYSTAFSNAFQAVDVLEGGISPHELLAFASRPRDMAKA